MSYIMNKKEGNSFNRIYGFERMKYPEKDDYDRVRNIFRRLNDDTILTYYNGQKVSEEQLAKVQEKL